MAFWWETLKPLKKSLKISRKISGEKKALGNRLNFENKNDEKARHVDVQTRSGAFS